MSQTIFCQTNSPKLIFNFSSKEASKKRHFDQRLIFNEKKISVRPNICIGSFVASTHLHKKSLNLQI